MRGAGLKENCRPFPTLVLALHTSRLSDFSKKIDFIGAG